MSTDLERRALVIFETALSREGGERERFVAEACGDDSALRLQVESLLEAHARKGSFLEASPLESETAIREELVAGQRFGAYSILRALGRGGMGEVYLAQDSRLGRKVALKLLRSEYTRDPERMKRFEREARAASALNHPHLLTVHEIGEEGTRRFMASEYVEGESLREILSKRKMSLEEAVDVGVQVASGLSAAHEAGVVHRDVKPDNVMVRPDGFVKVLDLGLAKLLERGALGSFASGQTETGMVMGTLKYMSPEQARAQAVDERTDVFSLGVMLYEMVSGRPPFEGPSSSDVLVALLEKEPPALSGRGTALEDIVSRALEKDPSKRHSTMKELLSELREVKRGLDAGARPRRRARFDLRKAGVVGAALALVVAATYYFATRTSHPGRTEATFTRLTSQSGPELYSSLSPDGKWFLFVSDAAGNDDIYLQAVGGQNPINLTKDSSAGDTTPAFSPDGERIAFRSERVGGGIYVMGRTGESPRLVAEKGFLPTWSPDGQEIAFSTRPFQGWNMAPAPGGAIWAVEVSSGQKRTLYSEDGTYPSWSPHGHRVAFTAHGDGFPHDVLTVAASGAEEAVPAAVGAPKDGKPVWSPDGKYLYLVSDRGGSSMNLWRLPIDERSGKALGEPEPLTAPATDVDHLSVSADGKRVAYVSQDRRANLQMVAFDPARATVLGEPISVTSGSNWIAAYNVSPDGEGAVYHDLATSHPGFWVVRADGTGALAIGDYDMSVPSWSADGWIAFNKESVNGPGHDIFRIRPDGTSLEPLTDHNRDGNSSYGHSISSPDGSRIAIHTMGGKGGNALVLDVRSGLARPPEALPPLTTGGEFFDPHSWSPDGEWLAGQAIDSNLRDTHHGIVIYSLENRTYEKLTDFGAGATAWLPDSCRLLFTWEGKVHLLDRVTRETRVVFSVPLPERVGGPTLSRDGRTLFFLRSIDEADVWLAELK